MRHEIPLSTESWSTLDRMSKGASLVGRRTFPLPHTFKLSKPEGAGDYAKPIAPATIDQLVTLRLVAALSERSGDVLRYALTPRAESAISRGALFEDDHAVEMFGTVAP